MDDLQVTGMSGIGDAVHHRAIVRWYIEQGHRVWLETAYPEFFWDLRGDQLKLIPIESTRLRHARANMASAEFDHEPVPSTAKRRVLWYKGSAVRRLGYVGAMADIGKAGIGEGGFTLPIHPSWKHTAEIELSRVGYFDSGKPLLIYKPPSLRQEWLAPARNPDAMVMPALLEAIRDRFFVISIANVAEGVEWIDGPTPAVDAEFNHGQLHPTTIAAMMVNATVMTPPSFPLCIGRAVNAWTIGVFGGHELSDWYRPYTPMPERFISIDPVSPCGCWNRQHSCDKTTDIPAAVEKVVSFCENLMKTRTGPIGPVEVTSDVFSVLGVSEH